MILKDNKVVDEMFAPSFSTDAHNVLTPAYFMQILEDRGSKHAEWFGMGYEVLLKSHLVWVVSRLHLHFVHPIKWGDEFVFSTWHMGQEDGIFFRREAQMADLEGTPLILATTGWLLLDIEKRTMVRHCDFAAGPETYCLEKTIEEPAPKLRIPASVVMNPAYVHEVRYSDLDRNFHVNNTRYASLAMDALPDDVHTGNGIRDFYINFVHEARPHQQIKMYMGEETAPQDGTRVFYVEGKVEEHTSFIVKVVI